MQAQYSYRLTGAQDDGLAVFMEAIVERQPEHCYLAQVTRYGTLIRSTGVHRMRMPMLVCNEGNGKVREVRGPR